MQFLAGRIFSSAAIACRQSVQQHAETAGRASHAGWELLPCPARKTRAPALVGGRQGGGQSRLADLLSALGVPGLCAGERVPFHRLGWLCVF